MHMDMPLSELKGYMGKSPKPDDFDQYWERALAELDQQPLEYELIPANMKTSYAECFHLYFIGVGGARVHCKFVKPTNIDKPGPGLAYFHGYSVDSGEWMGLLPYAAEGFTMIALDCRGQGGLSEDNLVVKGPTLRGHIIRGIDDPNPDNFYYRNVFLDTVQATRILMSMASVDADRIGVFGMSQGGALATACAALEPRVKEVVAAYPFLSDYKRVWQEMDINNSAYEEIAYYFRALDPNHEREEYVFNKLGYIDIQNLANRIQANYLMVVGMKDGICPPSTQFATYNKIQSPKDLLIYPEYGHEYLPYLGDKTFKKFLNL
jgi:cephalosporin-C deacetylase